MRVARFVARTPTALAAYPDPSQTRRIDRALVVVSSWGLVLAALISAALVFGVAVGGGSWVPWFRLAAGIVLLLEGLLLTRDWRGMRRLIVARSYHRARRRRGGGAVPLSQLVLWKLTAPLLGLLGLAWFFAGAVSAALGLAGLL
jgi:uncharacterized protein YjeT (DUF2065 family)